MQKLVVYFVGAVAIVVVSFYGFNSYIYQQKQGPGGMQKGYRDTMYVVNGQTVALVDGSATADAAPGSAAEIVTKVFGNEAEGDLNADGISDIAFLLTQDMGGSGVFYYVAVGIKTDTGYAGTNAVILGDRIAPQSTEIRDGQLIVNYAIRPEGAPFSESPSVGESKYLQVQGDVLVEVPASAATQ